MKDFFKKSTFLFLIICLCVAWIPVTVFAGASGSVSSSEVEIGSNVSVTFKFSYDENIGGVQGNISYDSSILKYVSCSGSQGDTTANSVGNTIIFVNYIISESDAKTTYSFTAKFTALAVGSTTVTLNETTVASMDDKSLGSPTSSVSLSVKAKAEAKLSSVCTLKALQPPKGCTLTPAFSSSVTEYSCTVPYSVEKFPLEPTKSDSNAKVEYIGSVALKVGDNTRSVKVTAQDGTTKTYTVKIKRLSQEESPADTVTPTPATEITPDSTIAVKADGVDMVMNKTITSAAPENFTTENFTYDGTEVQSLVLGSVRLVELDNGEECGFYIINEANKTFEKFVTASSAAVNYTFLSESETDLSEFEKTTIKIDENNEVTAWFVPEIGEGYYVLSVMNNATGDKYLALYCVEDGTIQKMSENILNTDKTVESVETSANADENANLYGKFINFIKSNSKYIILAICGIVIVGAIVTIIIIFVKQPKKEKIPHDWLDENSFEVDDANLTDLTDSESDDDEDRNFIIYTGHDSDFE